MSKKETIVDRLRLFREDRIGFRDKYLDDAMTLMLEAADEIERLEGLISAAPDLLAALRAIAEHQENVAGEMARASTTWNIAVRAIEKAGFQVR